MTSTQGRRNRGAEWAISLQELRQKYKQNIRLWTDLDYYSPLDFHIFLWPYDSVPRDGGGSGSFLQDPKQAWILGGVRGAIFDSKAPSVLLMLNGKF